MLIKTERQDGDGVRLTVRDTGLGLSPQSVNSLFDAFYTAKSGGMGIGLFVSRSIVERHYGRLWAEPNHGGPGATFSFSIPNRTPETSRNGRPRCGLLKQIVEAFPEDSALRYIVRDRDGIFGEHFRARVEGLGIEEIRTAPNNLGSIVRLNA